MILKQTKWFDCSCNRCLDPSEHGTYLSALQCRACSDKQEGKLLPKMPTDSKSDYVCSGCGSEISGESAQMMLDTAMKFLGRGQGKVTADSDPTQTLELMNHLSRFVAQSHQVMVDLKLRLISQVIAQISNNGTSEIVREKLLGAMKDIFIQTCLICPTQSRVKARLSQQYYQLKTGISLSEEVW